MANYLSYHAGTEGKHKKTDIKGATGHTFRKTEKRYENHSNENIDPTQTHKNIDWTQDGKKIEDIVEDRLERDYRGMRALRKDAVVVREIIMQASPNIYDGLSEDDAIDKSIDFTNDCLGWCRLEFGDKNVIGASIHNDETNSHPHILIMPMTEDGRMSQKDFFKGPGDLRRQHKEFREYMNDRGWNFEEENKHIDAEGVDQRTYSQNAEAIEARREENNRMVAELAEDPQIEARALDLALNKILKDEYEKIDAEKAEIEEERERLKEYKNALDEQANTNNHIIDYMKEKEEQERPQREFEKMRALSEQAKLDASVVLPDASELDR